LRRKIDEKDAFENWLSIFSKVWKINRLNKGTVLMKKMTFIILLAATAALSGCVRRTVTVDYENRGSATGGKTYGGETQVEVVEEKTIWIWQKEFRNP
jgi:hypothetical protein